MNRFFEWSRLTPAPSPRRVARFLWETLTLPYWLGSALPPPALPGRREARGSVTERMPVILRQLDMLRATIWRQRAGILAARAGWIAFGVLDAWLVLRVVAGRHPAFVPFLLLALLVLLFGGLLIALARPTRDQLARTLDRSFGLRERVSTALEGARGGRLTGLRALQVVEATHVAEKVSRASAFRRQLPVREIVLALIAVLLFLGLLIGLLSAGKPNPLDNPLAGRGAKPGAQSGMGQGGQQGRNGQREQNGAQGNSGQGQQGTTPGQSGKPSAQGQQDLDTLAGALRDHAATRNAADRLANGDTSGAANAIREAGQGADKLSPEARARIARDLRDAAGKVADPKLARDLKEAANALEQPNAAGVVGAFDKVAGDVERIGQGQGQTGGQQGQGGQGQAPQTGGPGAGASPQLPSSQRNEPTYGQVTPPLGADGKPIELPKGANGQDPTIDTRGNGNKGAGTADPGAAGVGGGQLRQGEVGESGADPNQVPYEQRGAVERYFTPQRPQE